MAADKGRSKGDRNRSDDDDDDDDDDDEVFSRPEDEAGKRALARERRAARAAKREAAELRERIEELEGKDKPDIERLKGENEKLKGERDAALLKADRLEVAIDKGLTKAQAKRLVGSTREELEEDADEILEAFPSKHQRRDDDKGDDDDRDDKGDDDRGDRDERRRPPSQRPRTDELRGGREPSKDVEEMDPAKLAEFIPRP